MMEIIGGAKLQVERGYNCDYNVYDSKVVLRLAFECRNRIGLRLYVCLKEIQNA